MGTVYKEFACRECGLWQKDELELHHGLCVFCHVEAYWDKDNYTCEKFAATEIESGRVKTTALRHSTINL
jgi:hypothetical protein